MNIQLLERNFNRISGLLNLNETFSSNLQKDKWLNETSLNLCKDHKFVLRVS